MARAKREMVTFSVRVPKELHEVSVKCADSVSQSLNAFVVQAMAARARRWRDPVTGKLVRAQATPRGLEGWTCYHGVHAEATPAHLCEHQGSASHRLSWAHPTLGQDFDGWAAINGVPLPDGPPLRSPGVDVDTDPASVEGHPGRRKRRVRPRQLAADNEGES